MRVEIPVSKWGRGEAGGYFLNEIGHYCALGFIFKAFGIPDEELSDRGSLSTLPVDLVVDKVPPQFYTKAQYTSDDDDALYWSNLSEAVTETNDDPYLTEEARRTLLTTYLAPFGVELVFLEDDSHDVVDPT